MSINTNGFIKQGVNPFELKKYLEKNIPKLK